MNCIKLTLRFEGRVSAEFGDKEFRIRDMFSKLKKADLQDVLT